MDYNLLLKKMDRMELQITSISKMLGKYVLEEFNTRQAAEYLEVSPKTIHNLRAAGHLQGKKKGSTRVYTRQELDDYLTSKEQL